ncbi:ABC transporter ATP-binding protein [Allopontixanthobacter sp.]|uniref:ABC transporter ATP-binding protein n=1 Tax=Allopontixanthobacter sp. TaxID=2906452 RepID=UPI002ABA36CB|nr:ABC transporter ATP-binding protein [Allopontixanthobacter sp.]MDZ4307477.1 ABC transporter ATP-binding protein [Allopontixanthobacter sp.]
MATGGALANFLLPIDTGEASAGLKAIAKPYSRWVPVIAVFGLAASLMEGVGIGLIIPLLAVLLADAAPSLPVDVPPPTQQLLDALTGFETGMIVGVIVAGIFGLIVLKGIFQAANDTLIAWIEGRIAADIRDALAARTIGMDYPFFLIQPSARLIKIIATDSWLVADTVRWKLSIVSALTGLMVFAAILAWLDWRLFAIVLIGGLLIAAAVAIPKRWLRGFSEDVSQANQALAGRMLAIVDSIRIIRVFGQENREQSRFVQASGRVRRSMFASQRLSSAVGPASEVAATLVVILVVFSAYALGMSIPVASAFLILLTRALPQARMVNAAHLGIASVREAVRETQWLLAQSPLPAENVSAVPLPVIDRSIRFENVSYTYPDGTCALQDICAVIEPGTVTALIGPSGSGKTSLINLICRLVEPDGGSISHGEQPIRHFSAAGWRSHIAIAGQDVGLIDGTIAENIAYGFPAATRAQIAEAAEAAGAADFIDALRDGFDSPVGIGGGNLSGGQRQRIGLARALLRRPDLLILDEATSEVDLLSESRIMTLLARRGFFRTAIVISHRAGTLASCERGIVFQGGRIVESGPIEQLACFDRI